MLPIIPATRQARKLSDIADVAGLAAGSPGLVMYDKEQIHI
jgi:hypothetical protein